MRPSSRMRGSNQSRCRGSNDCSHLWGGLFEADGECKQECEGCRNGLSHSAREDVMLHHLHPARDRGTDAIQSQTWHRAENQCKRRNHLRLHVKTVVKNRSASITMPAVMIDCTIPKTTAIRKS